MLMYSAPARPTLARDELHLCKGRTRRLPDRSLNRILDADAPSEAGPGRASSDSHGSSSVVSVGGGHV
eukprot:6298317-Prymnesium_polylepis.1